MALLKGKNFKIFISFWFCEVDSAIHTRLSFLFQLYRLEVYLLSVVIFYLLFVAVIYLFTRNTCTSCEISSNLVQIVLAFLFFLLEATFTSCSCISFWIWIGKSWLYCQKQPSICVLKKSCSEKIQESYRKTTVPKCDFNQPAPV